MVCGILQTDGWLICNEWFEWCIDVQLWHCPAINWYSQINYLSIKTMRAAIFLLYSWYIFISHDDGIKWKHFPRDWPFVRGIHRSPVNSPHKDQWRGALMFSLICACINGRENNREAGDLGRHRVHHDVTVMSLRSTLSTSATSTSDKQLCKPF